MKTSRKTLVWGIACSSVLTLSVGVLAYQFNPQPDPPGHYFGLIRVNVGQQVSVHVVNRKMPVTRVNANDTCRAELHVVDGKGADLKTQQGRVLPSQSMSLNFTVDPPEPDRPVTADPPAEADPPGGRLLRAFVLFAGDASHCLSSMDVVDATGRSIAMLSPNAAVTLNPPSNRPGDVRH